MKVYGHRGAGGEAPENTLAAFRHAIERGVRYLEVKADSPAVMRKMARLLAKRFPTSRKARKVVVMSTERLLQHLPNFRLDPDNPAVITTGKNLAFESLPICRS